MPKKPIKIEIVGAGDERVLLKIMTMARKSARPSWRHREETQGVAAILVLEARDGTPKVLL